MIWQEQNEWNYKRHHNLIISCLEIKVTHVSFMKILPLFSPSTVNNTLPFPPGTMLPNISFPPHPLFQIVGCFFFVAAREELEHLMPLAFRGVAIKCVCSVWTDQCPAFLWQECHRPWNDGSLWQGSQGRLVEREILSTVSSSEPQICYSLLHKLTSDERKIKWLTFYFLSPYNGLFSCFKMFLCHLKAREWTIVHYNREAF